MLPARHHRPPCRSIAPLSLAIAGVLVWMPIYLLVMQRRVYGESWLVTSLKFTVLGWLYFSVVTVATALLALASLANI